MQVSFKMRIVVVLAAFIPMALAASFYLPPEEELLNLDIGPNITYLIVEDKEQPDHYVIEDLVNAVVDGSTSESDVTYYFYSKNNTNDGIAIKSDNVEPLGNTDFDVSKDTFLIIHGWRDNYQSDVNVLIKNAVLPRYDVNLFVVDWSPIADRNYVSAQAAVTDIGKFVADFLQTLKAVYKLDLSKVSMGGHSLGAHVSGNAGAALNGALDHIVGMDPAVPLFSIGNIDNRLDPTDAKFVQVIHSCGGVLGFYSPIGHVDYYPNGGVVPQPGCGIDITGACAHSRSYIYYAESVAPPSKPFVSKKCESYREYSSGSCDNNAKSDMGGYQVDKGASGTYYLHTNSQSPFAQG